MAEKANYDAADCSLLFPSSGAKLFLNREDNRAQFLIRKGQVSQQRLFDLWTGLLDAFEPAAVIDIGANYGEVFVPRRLPQGRRLDLYEANPTLVPYLERARQAHPDHDRIRVFGCGVSSEAGFLAFNVDRKWSGTSSFDFRSPDGAYKGSGPAAFDRIEVPTVTLEEAVNQACTPGTAVAVKIDTEGHELKVLAHVDALRARRFALVMEASPAHQMRAGASISRLRARAGDLGNVFRITRAGTLVPLTDEPLTEDCDLLVTNDAALADWARNPARRAD